MLLGGVQLPWCSWVQALSKTENTLPNQSLASSMVHYEIEVQLLKKNTLQIHDTS
jgi:hypothetical protein